MEWRDIWRRLTPSRWIEVDVHDEIAFHIEARVRERVDQGWSEEEARIQVASRFGDVAGVERACRGYDAQRLEQRRGRRTMERWARDARWALRSMRRDAGFTAVVVTTLALGIGASTAVFSVVEGVLLRPLPYPDADRLAVVWENDRATGTLRENASPADVYDLRERTRAFEGLAMHAVGTAVLVASGGEPTRVDVAAVERTLPEVLGVQPSLGRTFTSEEDAPEGPGAVILSDAFWRSRFGADPAVLGRSLELDEQPREVVGVLPPGVDVPADVDLWVPLRQSPGSAERSRHWVGVLGRLREGAHLQDARADVDRIMAELEQEFPGDNLNRGGFVEPLRDVGRGDVRGTLWVLFAAVLVVLGIACVNAANLLMARGAGRARELALLVAVGAGRGDVTRRFVVEAGITTALAAAIGLGLARMGVRALMALAPDALIRLGTPSVDGPVLAFTLAVSVVVSLAFGLLPALQSRGTDVRAALAEGAGTGGGRTAVRVRRALVAGQVGLAVVLMLGAVLLAGTVRNLQAVDPGFDPEGTLRVDFTLPASRYPTDMSAWPDWPVILAFLDGAVRETEAVPGVRSAAVTLNHPLDPGFTNSFRIEGRDFDPSQGEITTRMVTAGYFATAGVARREGRLLQAGDRVDTEPVIVLNHAAADRYFPEGDALGGRLAFWGPTWRRVVGIVEDERSHGLDSPAPPALYVPMAQAPPRGGSMTLVARADVPPLSLANGVQAALRRADPGVATYGVSTLEATVADAVARERFASRVMGTFAVAAVVLALLGVHGVLAYVVSLRRREFGVRLALGATSSDVAGLVVRQAASIVAMGVTGGLVVAWWGSRALEGLLFGVRPTETWAYLLAGSGLAAVGLAASFLTARQAAAVDPLESLRGD